jgi:hypothetical protein
MSTHPRTLSAPVSDVASRLSRPDLAKHQARCSICKHDERERIDAAFLQWSRVINIVHDFKLPSRSCVYDHARAFNLFELRARNIRFALEHIVENVEDLKPTAHAVIEAVKVLSHLDENGRWHRPAARVVVESQRLPRSSQRDVLRCAATVPLGEGENTADFGSGDPENSEILIATPQEQNSL